MPRGVIAGLEPLQHPNEFKRNVAGLLPDGSGLVEQQAHLLAKLVGRLGEANDGLIPGGMVSGLVDPTAKGRNRVLSTSNGNVSEHLRIIAGSDAILRA